MKLQGPIPSEPTFNFVDFQQAKNQCLLPFLLGGYVVCLLVGTFSISPEISENRSENLSLKNWLKKQSFCLTRFARKSSQKLTVIWRTSQRIRLGEIPRDRTTEDPGWFNGMLDFTMVVKLVAATRGCAKVGKYHPPPPRVKVPECGP